MPVSAPAAELPEPAPLVEHMYPGDRGYVKLFVPEGETPEPPAETGKPKRQAPREPEPVATLEVALASDVEQKRLVDEYGELDRRMQLRATDTARYETLKKAIKGWFDSAPADADGTVEGAVYLLHLSARERERKLRSVRDLVEIIGLDQVLDLAVVPLGALENVIGRDRVAGMIVEARSGSRRIKAIPKGPATV